VSFKVTCRYGRGWPARRKYLWSGICTLHFISSQCLHLYMYWYELRCGMLSCIPSATKRCFSSWLFFLLYQGAASWRGELEVGLRCSGLGYDTVQSCVNLGRGGGCNHRENIKFRSFNCRIRVEVTIRWMEHVAGVGNTINMCRILVGKDRLLVHLNVDWRIILKQIFRK